MQTKNKQLWLALSSLNTALIGARPIQASEALFSHFLFFKIV